MTAYSALWTMVRRALCFGSRSSVGLLLGLKQKDRQQGAGGREVNASEGSEDC